MENGKPRKKYSLLLKSFVFIGLFWTILFAFLMMWTIKDEKGKLTNLTLAQARSFFKQIVTTRYWNSTHGGVYVPVTKETQPNPFLDTEHREVITKDGQLLTLINPAYMTRQIADIAYGRDQVQFHITSLKPIRPDNAPEEWEASALRNFSPKKDEYYGWWAYNSEGGKSFRYMAPLWTEKPCLNCHSRQGYVEGDLRGGISITIPANTILSRRDSHIKFLALSYVLIWFIGVSGIFFFFRLSRREYMERSRLIEKLENALKEVRTLKGFIPICSSCKKVRNDEGYWDQIETYIKARSDAKFSHSICPDCRQKLYPEYTSAEDIKDDSTK